MAPKLEVAGLDDLEMAGPMNAANAETDDGKPYRWTPGDDYPNGAISYTDANGNAGGLPASRMPAQPTTRS